MDESYAKKYQELEQQHWWFKGRRKILKTLLASIKWKQDMNVLEIGIGSGVNLYSLYPDFVHLYGIEPSEHSLMLAQKRGNIPVFKGTAENLPTELTEKNFDIIAMFDVLEHIENDLSTLNSLQKNKLVPGGKLILTVPAYQWMWGQQDIISHHYRRYTLNNLQEKLDAAGLKIKYATYFNTFLFAPIAFFRVLNQIKPIKHDNPDTEADFKYSLGFLDMILYKIFSFESKLLKKMRFPFGVSLYVVAEKV